MPSMDPHAIDARVRYAKALAASSIIPDAYRGQPANVLVAIETGAALGIPAPQALGGLAVIKGKPTMTADLMSAVVRRAGHRLRVTEHDGAVTASLVRSDDPEFTYKVTWDRAKAERAGLWGTRGPWVSYPGQMLRSRAVAEVCRQGASDALMGVIYSPEEMGAPVDEEGAVIDSGPSTTTAAAAGGGGIDVEEETVPEPPHSPSGTAPAGPLGFVTRWLGAHGMDPSQAEPLLAAATEDLDAVEPQSLTRWLNANALHTSAEEGR
nr:MAG TPA: RecT protein [Caudoviricetes sp.]